MGFSNGFFSKRTLFNVIGPRGETKENFKLKRQIRKIKITIIHNSRLTVIKSAIRIIEIYWIVRECTIYGSSLALSAQMERVAIKVMDFSERPEISCSGEARAGLLTSDCGRGDQVGRVWDP